MIYFKYANNSILYHKMYTISTQLYRLAARRILDVIADRNYFSGSIAFVYGDIECRFTASLIIRHTRRELPEGVFEAVSEVVPVWWEFHTSCGGTGEILNDFSFAELAGYLY